jgi:uncharacterized membrane protein
MTDIYFRNDTSFSIYVAIKRYEPGTCGGSGDWLVKGWWEIKPRSSQRIGPTNNSYFYYYAEGNGYTWSGDSISYVEQQAFAHCDNSTLGRRVGMREDNCDNYGTYTVPLYI